jgi:hypothetical protein
MVSLSTAGASRLQAQIGEAVAEIAEMDFPERWPTLIDVSVAVIHKSILRYAYAIHQSRTGTRWRSFT